MEKGRRKKKRHELDTNPERLDSDGEKKKGSLQGWVGLRNVKVKRPGTAAWPAQCRAKKKVQE